MVALLTVGFGLVGLDRMILAPLFPTMMVDLNLDYQDLGYLAGILGVAWGIAAIVAGNLSDRFGRRTVLAPAVLAFSLLSALSGVATGLVSLLLLRALMGAAEGAVASTGVAVAVEASHPKRRGMNNGLFQCGFPLFGFAIAPIVATQMLQVTTWRNVFLIVGIPGIVVAILLWFTVREPLTIAAATPHPTQHSEGRASLAQIFKHRNVPLAMATLLCAMTGIFVMGAIMPSYLVNFLKLSNQQMGLVTSGIGFGACLGTFTMPTVSDFIGRRLPVILSFALAASFLYCFTYADADNLIVLFVLLFFAALFTNGALALIAGPLAAEAAPAGRIASVAGLVIGVGEIFGGGIAPAIAGGIAKSYGLQYTLVFAVCSLLLGLCLSFFLRETAPRKVRSPQVELSSRDEPGNAPAQDVTTEPR